MNICQRLFTLIISTSLSVSLLAQNSTEVGSVQFSFDLFKKISSADNTSNIFFSPISMSNAFSVPYLAASGMTQKQIQSVFYYDENAKKNLKLYKDFTNEIEGSKDVTIRLANSLWVDESLPINASFTRTARQYTGRDELFKVNFSKNHEDSRAQINSWIEKTTSGNIKDLFPARSINELTRFIMASAVYFKGDWQVKFDEKLTAEDNFYGVNDKVIRTSFMTRSEGLHRYYENDKVQVLELPYAGESTSMMIILPRFKADLKSIESQLSVKTYKNWLSSMTKRPVIVSLPKFNLKIQYDLRSTLRKMGLKEPFTDAANFDNMTTNNDLKLTKVYHQSFIIVSESGTEATGATGVVGNVKGPQPLPAYFNANQPFIFLIKDNKTDIILFIGRLTEPSASNEVSYRDEEPLNIPAPYNIKSALTSKVHFVEKGESLYKISRMYGVKVEELQKLNGMTDFNLQVGQELFIEKSTSKGEKVTPVIPKPQTVAINTPQKHEVFPGESLFSISRKYNLTVEELKSLNGISGNVIQIGQELIVRQSTEKPSTTPIQTAPKSAPPVVTKPTYIVKKGDTLWGIARINQLSVTQLKQLNNLSDNTVLIGQELRIN